MRRSFPEEALGGIRCTRVTWARPKISSPLRRAGSTLRSRPSLVSTDGASGTASAHGNGEPGGAVRAGVDSPETQTIRRAAGCHVNFFRGHAIVSRKPSIRRLVTEASRNQPTPTPDARSVKPSESRRPILRASISHESSRTSPRLPVVRRSRQGRFQGSRIRWMRRLIPVRSGEEPADGMAFGRRWDASQKKFTWHPAARRIVCVSGTLAPRAAPTNAYAVRRERVRGIFVRIGTNRFLKQRTFFDPYQRMESLITRSSAAAKAGASVAA
jgi:hypothetical protein